MTEIGCAYQSLPSDSDDLASTTVGFPGEHVEVKLVDKLENIVPLGQVYTRTVLFIARTYMYLFSYVFAIWLIIINGENY